ncbi:MAG: glycosyltransferase family 39 protein [Chloroflexi bacterium]|nr:glycosyltransferase family 39 protein [Chloroflexota bacterium]
MNEKVPKGLWAVLIAFVLLGAVYAFRFPLFEKPDEPEHYEYAHYLKTRLALPKVSLSETQAERPLVEMEAHQPPLYYALVAAAASPIKGDEFDQSFSRNPHFLSTRIGNINRFVPVYERGSSTPVSRTLLVGRLVSLAFGALAVFATYLLAREFTDANTAVFGAGLMAFNTQFLFIATSFSNDTAMIALVNIALWRIVRWARQPPTPRSSLITGAILGAAVLAKLTAIGLLGILLATAALRTVRKREFTRGLLCLILTILAFTAVTGWWFARNYSLYHDPLAFTALDSLMGRRTAQISLQEVLSFLNPTWKSYWFDLSVGFLGFAASPAYWAIFGVTIVALLGAAKAFFQERALRPYMGILSIWLLILVVSFLRLNFGAARYLGGGRLLFAGSAAFALILAIGIKGMFRARLSSIPQFTAIAGLVALAIVGQTHYVPSLYAMPPIRADLPPEAQGSSRTRFGDATEVVGYVVSGGKRPLRPGDRLDVTLYWRPLERIEYNYSVSLQLLAPPDGKLVSQIDSYPGRGTLPTSQWRTGEIVEDKYELSVPHLVGQQALRLAVRMYYLPTGERLPAFAADGKPVDDVILARLPVDPDGGLELPENAFRSGGEFDGLGRLLGVQVEQNSKGQLAASLYWQTDSSPDRDYTVSVQLSDSRGTIVAENGTQPNEGALPTSTWWAGGIIIDKHTLQLPAEHGAFNLDIAVYDSASGQRLPVLLTNGRRAPDDILFISSLDR